MAATCEQFGQAFRGPDAREQGSSLVAILSVVATLGILVAITLTLSLGTSTPPTHPRAHASATTTTVPKDAASGASEATLAACEANYTIVDSAVETYRAFNGTDPPAGTRWATSSADGGPLVQSWPSSPSSYAITWNGKDLSVVPSRGTPARGSEGSQALKTGCYAL